MKEKQLDYTSVFSGSEGAHLQGLYGDLKQTDVTYMYKPTFEPHTLTSGMSNHGLSAHYPSYTPLIDGKGRGACVGRFVHIG